MTLRITLSIGLAVAALAVNEGAVVGLGSTSGDQLVMFRATAGTVPTYELVVSRSDGSALRVLVGRSNRRPVSPRLFGSTSWSPDGKRLAFTGFPARFDDPRSDLYTVRADGTGLRRLTRTGRALAPAWSPDGQTIAYAQRADHSAGPPFSATLWVLDVKGARTRQLWPGVPGRVDVPGSWSPDSKRIAFTRAFVNRESGAA